MGGGESQPKDELGGQYASFSYTPPVDTGLFGLSQSQWSGIGKGVGGGFQQYGQGMASGGSAQQSSPQAQQFASTPIEGASPPFALIPESGSTGNEILQLLQRMGLT